MAGLYQFAVLLHPTKEGKEQGEKTKVVVPPSDWMLAESEQEVVLMAGRALPEEEMVNASRLEVAVRPF